jgi:hypothetical protein
MNSGGCCFAGGVVIFNTQQSIINIQGLRMNIEN